MKKKYKHLFFDLDNTLWDLDINARISLEEVFAKHNLAQYFDHFDHFFDLYTIRNNELWELYPKGLVTRKQLNLGRFLYPLEQVGHNDEELANKLSDDFLAICPTKTNLLPHTIEILNYLKPNYNIHIISNGFSKMQYAKIKACGLSDYIINMYSSEAIGYHKPDKRIFEYAIKSSNALKKQSIMIGDNFQADIVGAKNFGLDQIYLSSDKSVILPFEPTYRISSLAEIKTIL
jgi:putative hydrolase of the HAD superfamily